MVLYSNSHGSCLEQLVFCGLLHPEALPCCIELQKAAPYLQFLLAASGYCLIWWCERVPASCQNTGTASSLAGSNGSQHARWPLPDVYSSASDIWAALLALSALEQVGLVQCCEGLYHGMGTDSSQTAFCCSLLTFPLACVIVQGLSGAHASC